MEELKNRSSLREYVVFISDYYQHLSGDIGIIVDRTEDNEYVVWNTRLNMEAYSVPAKILKEQHIIV
ncbi:MAG: hypothetical protein [Podoviridae sp. cty5g4]|nr:MAG: hypothetical protein [Podoviridae sp. cty5g4]